MSVLCRTSLCALNCRTTVMDSCHAVILAWSAVRALLLVTFPTSTEAASNETRYNQIQTMGTHNSYHVAPPRSVIKLLNSRIVKTGLGSTVSALVPSSWQVTQAPLTQQLANYGALFKSTGHKSKATLKFEEMSQILQQGIRQIELDVSHDPKGGMFGTAAALKLAGGNGTLPDPQYAQPGWKIHHMPDVDWQTTVVTFRGAMAEVAAWSTANPTHTPLAIYIQFETHQNSVMTALSPKNEGTVNAMLYLGKPPNSLITSLDPTPDAVKLLHSDIIDILGRDRIITPDDLRGSHSTLAAALLAPGKQWPTLASMQGKVLFVIIAGYMQQYLAQYPNLASPALMFVSETSPTSNATVFLEPADDPTSATNTVSDMASRVSKYVQQGYIVRARSDVSALEARANDYTRAEAILQAGAHILSTDFPVLPTFFSSEYALQLPSAMICNPLTTPVKGMPTFLSVTAINASQPAGPPDILPTCAATDSYTKAAAAAAAPPPPKASSIPPAQQQSGSSVWPPPVGVIVKKESAPPSISSVSRTARFWWFLKRRLTG